MLSSLNESIDTTNKQEQYLQSCCFGMVKLCRTWARDWGTWWEADRCSRCSHMGGNRSSSAVPWRAPAPLGALARTAPWSAPWRFSAGASLAPGQAGWSLSSVSVTEVSHYFTHTQNVKATIERNWTGLANKIMTNDKIRLFQNVIKFGHWLTIQKNELFAYKYTLCFLIYNYSKRTNN